MELVQLTNASAALTAPRFAAAAKKIAKPRAIVVLNGVEIYHEQELDPPASLPADQASAAKIMQSFRVRAKNILHRDDEASPSNRGDPRGIFGTSTTSHWARPRLSASFFPPKLKTSP